MPFPLESFERVFSDICAAGQRNRFVVVPEFTLIYRRGIERTKVADVAWLVTHPYKIDHYGLPKFRVVAAFEVEGYDVPLKTIKAHLKIYTRIKARYGPIPCYVPLYSKAIHRQDYGDDDDLVEDRIDDRKHLTRYPKLVTVCDARGRDWLTPAVQLADQLREDYLA